MDITTPFDDFTYNNVIAPEKFNITAGTTNNKLANNSLLGLVMSL